MNNFKIGNLRVDRESPAIIIAEAAVEHLGNLHAAKRMADSALECGADVIKYQMHLPEHEMLKGRIKFWGGSLDEILENYNLSVEGHKELIQYCETIGIQYLCTPFCPEAVKILDDLGVVGFKTGSGELTNFPLMEEISKTGKPVIVSSGMSTEDEIEDTVNFLKQRDVDFAITHCTSIYPSPYSAINLRYIKTLQEKFKVHSGHSDHTPTMWTAIGAVSYGAKIIEKHFTLSKSLKGPDFEVSLEPNDFKTMVKAIRAVEAATGTGKKEILKDEKVVREWAHHSIVTIKNVEKGDVFSFENLSVKRPGDGLPSSMLPKILGKIAVKDVHVDKQLTLEDVF